MRTRSRIAIFAALSGLILLVSFPVHAGVDPAYRDGLERLLGDLEKQGFTSEELKGIFSDSRFELYPHIVGRTGKGMNYMSRRFGLLTKRSIERGRNIMATYRDVLRNAEKDYGVDKEIIVAILRVETNFGSATGVYPVLNSLATMAVIENRRSEWARGELVELLALCREQNRDPFSIRGSWAGAFGISQFIPSSYVKFAVDGNSDGRIDLFTMSDAVASVANYLRSHGWGKGKPEENRQAVYAYNHCDSYVKAVFAYAKALRK
jgi:membrane-bound lytic murein transglycosylase B